MKWSTNGVRFDADRAAKWQCQKCRKWHEFADDAAECFRQHDDGRRCAWCQGPMTDKRADAVCCSTKCRVYHNRHPEQQAEVGDRFCDYCAKRIPAETNKRRKYCSASCRAMAGRARALTK